MEVLSEDDVVYEVRPFEASTENLHKLWSVFNKHRLLTNDYTHGNFEDFMDYMLSPQTVVYIVKGEKEDVGILYADSIIPGLGARGHYLFWDYKTQGRQKLILMAIKAFMDEFSLHRITFSLPIIAFAALKRVKYMGFRMEALRREAVLQNGEWLDTLDFAVLEEDLTEDALKKGQIKTGDDARWFKLLKNRKVLGEYFLRKEE